MWARQGVWALLLALTASQVLGSAAGRCNAARRVVRQVEQTCLPQLDTSVPALVTAKKPEVLRSSFAAAAPRIDDYAWLRDDFRNSTAVLSHLQEENAYAEAVLAPSQGLQAGLLHEMLGRIPREESSVPQRRGRFWYYSVHSRGRQYRRFCRRPAADPAAPLTEHSAMDPQQPEEVLLDQDELAGGRSFFDMSGPELSPDEQLMAYGVDQKGGEVYTLSVKNLTSGAMLLDGGQEDGAAFRACAGDAVFLNDSRTLLFTTQTEDTHRPDRVWWLDVGRSGARQPRLLYHEPDERFHLGLWRSRSDALVYLQGRSETTQYLQYLPAGADLAAGTNFAVLASPVAERQLIVRDCPAGSGDGYIYAIVSTAERRNGELVVARLGPSALPGAAAPGNSSSSRNATSAGAATGGGDGNATSGGGSTTGGYLALLQQHSSEVELVDLTVSTGHLAVLERRNGSLLATIYPLPKDGSALAQLPQGRAIVFDAPSYSLVFGDQGPFTSPLLRVRYSSLTQPSSTFDIHMGSGNRVLKQQQEVVGFDGTRYLSRLLWATSSGGVEVPVSVAYRGDAVKLDGSDPLLLEAYGAYGSSFDPHFSGARLSLLDRGFVYAIAHVRGGGELGRYWYQAGKLLAKNHTFDDVAAAAEFLIKAKYTSADRLALWGRSAGCLTVGAAVNRRPDLFQAAILDVPFVDVLSTMSDPGLPLTVIEYEEWGNPSDDEAAYRNIRSYSPVDNVAPGRRYPHLLLTGGLNDPRVSFWEPAKLAAKVRAVAAHNGSSAAAGESQGPGRLVLLRTNMAAGHFAESGLEGKLKEMAFKYAFLIQTVAPCAGLSAEQRTEAEGGGCRSCFAIFVAAFTTVALVTLAVVLNPGSRFGRRWRRLGGDGGGDGDLRGLGVGEDGEGGDGGGLEGFDTRRYSAHMSEEELAAAAAAEADRMRRARRRQLQQEGLSLAPYDSVRATVREQLLPAGAQPSAPLAATPPKRRLAPGGGSPSRSPDGIEMAARGPNGRGDLSPIAESPTGSHLSL